MAFIADTWFLKHDIRIKSYFKTHGAYNATGHYDWYIVDLSHIRYLWEDGTWNTEMKGYDGCYHYFPNKEAATDCATKYGYNYKVE